MHRLLPLVLLAGLSGCLAPGIPLPTDTRAPAPAEASSGLDVDALARQTFERVNRERVAQGIRPLVWSDTLAQIAAGHSADMARRNFFAHQNPDGLSVNDRAARLQSTCQIREGPATWTGFAENLAYEGDYSTAEITTDAAGRRSTRYHWRTEAELAAAATTGWMNSPGHRANILQRRSRRAGMGVVRADDHKVYFTQVFC